MGDFQWLPLDLPANLRGYVAGRGHAQFCNSLIIKYHSEAGVETQTFFGHVSTPRFINH